jgi:hypothetical protein
VTTLAEALVLVHAAFVVFVVVGGLAVMRWPRVAWVHVPAAVWGVLVECTGWGCPLTPLEKWLRQRGGGGGYEGGFIDHYLVPILYPDGMTRQTEIVLGALVVVVNVASYAVALWLRSRRTAVR